jgi:hypothetical protein
MRVYRSAAAVVYRALLLVAICIGGARARLGLANVSVLNQTNVYQTADKFDLGNALLCQNITDKWAFPLLKAADDFVVPSDSFFEARGVPHGLQDCGNLWLSLSTIRRKNDLSPASATLEFWRHNASSGLPVSTGRPFYSKTWPWPSNNYMWQRDWLNRPWDTAFRLQLNELGDDQVTRFAFRDEAFMPRDSPIWVAFYVTLALHQDQRLMANQVYWATLNNETGSTPPPPALPGGMDNHDFVYRDERDFLQNGWTQWTTAVTVERAMMIEPTTNQMAWRVAFECLCDPDPPVLRAPVSAPSGPATPSQPSSGNSSGAPSLDTDSNDNETTMTNTTDRAGRHSALHLLWLIAVPVTLILLTIGAGYVVWRQRRKPPFRGDGRARRPRHDDSAAEVLDALRQADDEHRVKLSVNTGSRSEASLFEDLDSYSTAATTTTAASYYHSPYSGGTGRNGPVVMSPIVAASTTYDHNNPFARHANDLMHVTISDDQED